MSGLRGVEDISDSNGRRQAVWPRVQRAEGAGFSRIGWITN